MQWNKNKIRWKFSKEKSCQLSWEGENKLIPLTKQESCTRKAIACVDEPDVNHLTGTDIHSTAIPLQVVYIVTFHYFSVNASNGTQIQKTYNQSSIICIIVSATL